MSDVPTNAPNIPAAHLLGALATSTVYALLLSTKTGRKWADEQTWSTVVGGTAMTLGWLATYRPRSAGWAMLFFMATGVPIVIRSLYLQLEKIENVFNRAMR